MLLSIRNVFFKKKKNIKKLSTPHLNGSVCIRFRLMFCVCTDFCITLLDKQHTQIQDGGEEPQQVKPNVD